MGLWSRFWFQYRVRTSAALDRMEDPRETLDYAYDQQQDMLGEVRRGLVEVATAKRQLQQQTRNMFGGFQFPNFGGPGKPGGEPEKGSGENKS